MQSLRADYAGFPEYAGRYRLESVLGSGGMGVVHLAASSSGLKLAVKVVHAQHAVDPEFRARFRQEVAAARRVSGAFTAPVVDADPDAERPWMATLFVDAPTLSERVRERVLDAGELTRLAAGLAEALRDIHRAGVVHRDLKPSNVLMAPDGVRVIDFGISRPADSDLRTETGKLIGTPPFMAPEQFQSPREVGTAADVFALGAVLVHAATGRGPFDSDSHYLVAYQVVHSEPDLTGLPARLVPVVARCLAKDPAERPTADALIAEIRTVTCRTAEDTQAFIPQPRRPVPAEEPTHRRDGIAVAAPQAAAPPPAGPSAQAPVRGRRARRLAVAAAVAVLLTGTALGGYLRFGTPREPSPAGAPAAAQRAFAPWEVTLAKPDSPGPGPACSWQAGGLFCRAPGVAAARLDPATGAVLWSAPAAGAEQRGDRDGAPLYAGGLVLSVASGSGALQALDPGSGAARWKRSLPGGARVIVAGGSVLLVGADGGVSAVDPADGRSLWTKQIGRAGSVWWGGPADARPAVLYLATSGTGTASTQLAAVDPRTGAEDWRVQAEGRLRPVGTAHGALHLLDKDAESKTTEVVRVDLTTRAVVRTRLASPLFDAQAAVGPDGTVYAVGTSGGLAAVGAARESWRLETGTALSSQPVVGDGRVFLSAADGRLLAVDAAAGRLAGQTRPRMGTGHDTFSATLPAPVVADGRVYGSAPDGSVFAVGTRDPAGW
ncbi:serine/threonine-protein kinase [Streptomyces sp. NPDC002032]|uniref:serine/threonine-protein kinase n=2 Tax=unclassified Streptomyces TaxID=2593676 RepID=UPI003681B732